MTRTLDIEISITVTKLPEEDVYRDFDVEASEEVLTQFTPGNVQETTITLTQLDQSITVTIIAIQDGTPVGNPVVNSYCILLIHEALKETCSTTAFQF